VIGFLVLGLGLGALFVWLFSEIFRGVARGPRQP
jgi:hypothetical protein